MVSIIFLTIVSHSFYQSLCPHAKSIHSFGLLYVILIANSIVKEYIRGALRLASVDGVAVWDVIGKTPAEGNALVAHFAAGVRAAW